MCVSHAPIIEIMNMLMKTTILSWLQNGWFSKDQFRGKKVLPMFRPDTLVVFRRKLFSFKLVFREPPSSMYYTVLGFSLCVRNSLDYYIGIHNPLSVIFCTRTMQRHQTRWWVTQVMCIGSHTISLQVLHCHTHGYENDVNFPPSLLQWLPSNRLQLSCSVFDVCITPNQHWPISTCTLEYHIRQSIVV